MATHDANVRPNPGMANDPNAKPSDRRTMTRDPNGAGGAIVEDGRNEKGLMKTITGSTHLTTCIDGKWYVCNTNGEPYDMGQVFANETDAVTEAQKHNPNAPGKLTDNATTPAGAPPIGRAHGEPEKHK